MLFYVESMVTPTQTPKERTAAFIRILRSAGGAAGKADQPEEQHEDGENVFLAPPHQGMMHVGGGKGQDPGPKHWLSLHCDFLVQAKEPVRTGKRGKYKTAPFLVKLKRPLECVQRAANTTLTPLPVSSSFTAWNREVAMAKFERLQCKAATSTGPLTGQAVQIEHWPPVIKAESQFVEWQN